jgi:hypothetical protein
MQDADHEGEMGVVLEFGVINGYKSNMVFKCGQHLKLLQRFRV